LSLYALDREFGPVASVSGGAQRLPLAMAERLTTPVQLGAEAVAIDVTADGVVVTTRNGDTVRAAFAVCALPFPVVRRLQITAPLGVAQREAINDLPYTQIVELYLAPETPFWEADGLAPDMWTDGPLERIFALRDDAGAPNGVLLAWVNGSACAAFAGKSDAEIEAMAGAALAALRPASGGRVRLLQAVRWTQDNPLAGGAYMHFAPGQIGRWAETMGAPAGRLHFAGEHLSPLYTGMEGAMSSGEAAAAAILFDAAP
jgi:monoamine oxidase